MREISSRMGVARDVDRALTNDAPRSYPKKARSSIVDPYFEEMTRFLTQFPRMTKISKTDVEKQRKQFRTLDATYQVK